MKAFAIISTSLALEWMQYTWGYNIYRAILLGFAMALVGLNVIHDAHHGSISVKSKVNYMFGLAMEWYGTSQIHWKQRHNVLHHLHSNTEADPDVNFKPLLRAHPRDKPNPMNKLQYLYIWPLLALYHLKSLLVEPLDLITGLNFMSGNHDKKNVGNIHYGFTNQSKRERLISLCFRPLFFLRFIILPLLYAPQMETLICILTTITVGSLQLGLIFVVSHNFEGVKFNKGNGDDGHDISFLSTQVETSSNWGGWIACQLFGGTNCEYILSVARNIKFGMS